MSRSSPPPRRCPALWVCYANSPRMPDVAIGEPRLLAHPADERLRHTRLTERCSSWRLPPASAHFGRVTDSGGRTDMHCASIRYGGGADWSAWWSLRRKNGCSVPAL